MIFRKARPWKILFAARLPRQNSLTAVPKRCTVFLFKKTTWSICAQQHPSLLHTPASSHPAHTITTWYLEYLCAAAPVIATHSGILSPGSHYNYQVPGVFVRSSTRCCYTLRHPLTQLTLKQLTLVSVANSSLIYLLSLEVLLNCKISSSQLTAHIF